MKCLKIKKYNNSNYLLIPKQIVDHFELNKESYQLEIDNGNIVYRKIESKRPDIGKDT